jgi:hypothetical protein
MTKAQEVYERINALVESGVKKADAFRQLAGELGQPVKSLQGAYYQHSRKANGGSTPSRMRETTPLNAVAEAKAVLEKARDRIDAEIEAAQTRAEEAHAEYTAMKDSAEERKRSITEKITALEA